jgi:hypothetical protein
MKTKLCRSCSIEKPAEAFPPNPKIKDGLGSYCRICRDQKAKASPKYKENIRKAQLKKLYKITPEQYQEMFDKQGGLCRICQSADTGHRSHLSIDHDHATGRVRGLLCHDCNLGLGKFKDDTNRLKMAIMYLSLTESL